jgi:hypothetical protein
MTVLLNVIIELLIYLVIHLIKKKINSLKDLKSENTALILDVVHWKGVSSTFCLLSGYSCVASIPAAAASITRLSI